MSMSTIEADVVRQSFDCLRSNVAPEAVGLLDSLERLHLNTLAKLAAVEDALKTIDLNVRATMEQLGR